MPMRKAFISEDLFRVNFGFLGYFSTVNSTIVPKKSTFKV